MAQRELTLFFVWCWFELFKKRKKEEMRRRARADYLTRYKHEWGKANRMRLAGSRRARYVECRERDLEVNRRWKENNPEKVAIGKKRWRDKNKLRLTRWYRAWQAKKHATDLGWRIRRCLSKRIWGAVRGETKKSQPTLKLLDCSIGELKSHLQAQFRPGMTWDNYGEWHIDHIRPCASYDLTDPEQQKACFNFKNLQPLWAKDNLSKGAKYNAS